MTDQWKVLGLMSGSSLDGVDLAFCDFYLTQDQSWEFNILKAETIPYPDKWLEVLKSLPSQTAEFLAEYDIKYGKYLGEISCDFLSKNKSLSSGIRNS